MAYSNPPTSIRLSDDALALCADLQRRLGLSRSAVIELAIRRLARMEKAQEEAPKPKPATK